MEPSALTVNTMPNSSRSWRSRRGAHETTKYTPVLRFAPQRGKSKWLCCARSRKRSFCWRALWHSVPDLLQRGAGTDGYACWWALLRLAGSVQRGSSGAGGPGLALPAADPFGHGDSVAVSLGGVRFRLPHDLHALDRDDRTDYTPPGRGGRKSAAFCLSDGGTVRGALRGGCSPFTDGLRPLC